MNDRRKEESGISNVQPDEISLIGRSSQLYRLIFENAPIGIFLFDQEGIVRECNDPFVRIMDSTRDELIGFDMLERLENEKMLEALKDTLSGKPAHYEGEYTPITGHGRPIIRLVFRQLMGEGGMPMGGVGIVEDVTKRTAAERELKESEEKYRLLVENANEVIIVAQDGVLKYTNPAATRMLGFTNDEMIGTEFVQYIHPDDLPMVVDRHQRRLDGEEFSHVYSFRLIGKNGEVKWFEINAVGFVWDGEPATLNFMTDVSERKSVEEIIASSEAKFRGLFESSRDGIIFCDMEGNIIDANGSFLDMLGFQKDEIVGRKLMEITPQKWHRTEDEMSFQKLTLEGDTGQYDKEYIRKDGSAIPVSARSWLMRNDRGESEGVWSMARDVSDDLRAEEEIKRRMIEIEKLNKFMIGREMRIIEMKREVNDLLQKSDQLPRYKV